MNINLTFDQVVMAIREYIVNHGMVPKGNYVPNIVWNLNFSITGVEIKLTQAPREAPVQPAPQQPQQQVVGFDLSLPDPNKKPGGDGGEN